MFNLSSQENKSDFGEGRGGKTGRKKRKGTKFPWQKRPPRPPTAVPRLLPRPHGSERSMAAGRGGFPLPGGPFRPPGPAAAPGTAAGRGERPSLLEAAAAQTTSGRRTGGREEQRLDELPGQGPQRKRSLPAGGGEGEGAARRHPGQSHGSNDMNDGGDGFLSFRY